jgi:pimeloyl-ACP methyl ester carboxylesterase
MSRTTARDFKLRSGATIHALLSEAFETSTNKAPVLCLSGFGCSHYNFIELEKDLGSDYPMVLVDNRGLGKSSPVTEDYALEDVVADAIEVMDQLNIKVFHLMGISMGGFLSQILTLNHPERVLSLTLMCTTSGGEGYVPMPEMTEDMLKGFYALPEPKKTEMAVEATAHPSIKEKAFGRFQSIVELRRSHPADVEQVLKQKRAVDKFLQKELPLESITAPTLVMTGDADRFVSPENGKRIHQKIKNSQFVSIEETDHLFFLEKPRQVGEAIKTFLSGLNKADRPQKVGASAGATV